jgi:hypothetical protein
MPKADCAPTSVLTASSPADADFEQKLQQLKLNRDKEFHPNITVKGTVYRLPCASCGSLHKNRRWIWLQQVPHGTPGCVTQEGNENIPFDISGLCYQAGSKGGTDPRPFNRQLLWVKRSNTYGSPTRLLICHKAYHRLPASAPTPQPASPLAVPDVADQTEAQDQKMKDLRQELLKELKAEILKELHTEILKEVMAEMQEQFVTQNPL